jgi:regulator of sigma E protease
MISPDTPGEILTAILTFIVAIGILVAVHEFGHFWVARKLGIRVLRFSIGFGKPLWQRTAGKDAVEYVIAAIPLGGYVKLLDERENADIPAAEVHRAFNRQPVWKRIAVLLAGPVFNLLFAVAVYWVLFIAGVPSLKPIIGTVEEGSIAERAGLQFEDLIVAVDGKKVASLEGATLAIIGDLIQDGTIDLRVRDAEGNERDLALRTGERRRELTDAEKLLPGLGFDFWRPRMPAIIGEVAKDTVAAKAGLQVNDEIVTFDGQPIEHFDQFAALVRPKPNQPATLEIRRGGQILKLNLVVGERPEDPKVGQLGVLPINKPLQTSRTVDDMMGLEQYGPVEAVAHAAKTTWEKSVFTLQIVGRIVTGDVSLKNISGPVRIAETTGFAVRQGWRVFLITLALISISLGVLNLLPIPILDGGQVVYQLAELVKGGPVSERAQLVGQQIGIAMLLLMMSLAFYNDIARHIN